MQREHLLTWKPFVIKKGNEQQLLEFTDGSRLSAAASDLNSVTVYWNVAVTGV